MEKQITAGGEVLTMKASALLPRQYRYHFGRDLIIDMRKAFEASGKSLDEIQADPSGSMDAIDMTVFENLAWLMLKNGGTEVGSSPEEWLDSVDDPMIFYTLLPEVVDLWMRNTATTARPKKK